MSFFRMSFFRTSFFRRNQWNWTMATVVAALLLGVAPAWSHSPPEDASAQSVGIPKNYLVDGKLSFTLDLPSRDRLKMGAIPPDSPIVASYNISQYGMQIPSLWWMQEQFGGKLLELWLAYPRQNNQPAWVDLLVNDQVWSLLNYLERYTFLNQFGSAARDYGYSTRVFNPRGRLLATYFCTFPRDFRSETASTALPECIATIGVGRQAGIRTTPRDATSPLAP